MPTKRLKTTRIVQRIAALPFNPWFDEAVKKCREAFQLPAEGFGTTQEARKWYRGEAAKCRSWGLTFDDTLHAGGKASEMPFERCCFATAKVFGLPSDFSVFIAYYILTGDKEWLLAVVLPRVTESGSHIGEDKQDVSMTVVVKNIRPWTTKKQWEQLWKDDVLPKRDELQKRLGPRVGKKALSIPSLREEMERYSQWYELAEGVSGVEGLGPTQALEVWEAGHPEKSAKYDVSTLTHAIRQFETIAKPTGDLDDVQLPPTIKIIS